MADTLKTLRAALGLLDAQWQCSRLWSMEEAQDCSETLRTLIASMEAQPEQKPVAWLVFDEDGLPEHATIDPQMAQDHINEAIQEFDFMQAAKWTVRPVYTHAQPSEPKAEPVRLPADERQGFIAAIADRDSIIKALLGQSVEKAIESKIRGDV